MADIVIVARGTWMKEKSLLLEPSSLVEKTTQEQGQSTLHAGDTEPES